MNKQYKILIGIDPGVNTGLAVYSRPLRKLVNIRTVSILKAMAMIKSDQMIPLLRQNLVFVRIEDPRQVKYKTDPEKAQGAGSVKRDAAIWEEFCTNEGIPFEMVRPNKRLTKFTAERFEQYTGWKEKTSTHGRDASLLVFGF